MTIHNIEVYNSVFNNQLVCKATIVSKNLRINNIIYLCDKARWLSDYDFLSDNQKKLCRKEWHKLAKTLGISRKSLNIII